MNSRVNFLWVLVVICSFSAICALLWPVWQQHKRHEQAQALAQDLGISWGGYRAFPQSYFQENLQPGSSMELVHMTVLGYVRVVQCHPPSGRPREVYYFYSRSDRTALRIEVFYDEAWRMVDIRGEDDDSRTIVVKGCVPGRLSETSE